MEDQLIGLEVAMLAKKKRFDVPCFDYFINDDFDNSSEKKQNHNLMGRVYSRPTQTTMGRWLREVHNINIDTTRHTGINTREVFYIATVQLGNKKRIVCRRKEGYEDALEEGLKEGLNLIQI